MKLFLSFLLAVLASTVGVSAATNDLNKALNQVIGAMGEDGFFEATWKTYFGGDPIPVPACTTDQGQGGEPVVSAADADESLKSVLDAGVIRVGISSLVGGIPSLYSTVGGEPSTVLNSNNPEDLDGYYLACMKEGVKRLNEMYAERQIDLEVVLVGGPSFFEPLRDALNDGSIDAVWTGMTVNDDRAKEIDFTCPVFQSDVVIAAGPNVASPAALPPADGPSIPVACTTVYCGMTVPAPFVLTDLGEGKSVTDMNMALLNATADGLSFDYVMGTASDLAYFFENNCPMCSLVDTPPVYTGVTAPATKLMAVVSNSSNSSATVSGDADNSSGALISMQGSGAFLIGLGLTACLGFVL